MPQTIHQRILFRDTTTEELYRFYMNAGMHSTVTGAVARIRDREGAVFSAYDGWCYGRNLKLVRNRLIVQSWRANDWRKDDLDSLLVLLFEPQNKKDVRVTMLHALVPDDRFRALAAGWKEFYWDNWKKYLKSKR